MIPRRVTDNSVLDQRRLEPCWICGDKNVDASHIKTRGSGGDDILQNVVAKCRRHHVEWGQIGWSKFFEKYPHFAFKLKQMGWDWSSGKLRLTHGI